MSQAASAPEPKTAAPGGLFTGQFSIGRALLYTGIIASLVFLLCTGTAPAPLIFLVELIIGPVGYLRRTLPNVSINPMAVLSAAVCTLGVLALGHWLARWLWREATAGTRRWRLRWTIGATAIIVLMFVAGIAATGVAHQSAWLARSDRPIFERRFWGRANQVKCASNLRQIGQAILLYAHDHNGRLPDNLEELAVHYMDDLSLDVLVCPSSNLDPAPGPTTRARARNLTHDHISYVYHGQGHKLPLGPDMPIACEPLFNHDGRGMNILFADGRVEWKTAQEAEEILRPAGASRGTGY